ncbi:MAG: peptidase M16 [Flavobacterium sp. BFFFF2]|nr:MAG: peptidase M16 [Flavobacterium sp. BFFFF2]
MKHFCWSYAVVFCSFAMWGQDLKTPIPFDAQTKMGKLENGLTYYIRKNAKPENKVDLRLVVNAGSILESDDQRGLAHFMEHMNFNGTKRFPKNQLVDYLQSIGVKFGQHLNAYTSFDETVYFLPIPSDKPDKVEKGLDILEDWAFNAQLTPEEIDKERGVVLEEYRIGLGADKRMLERYMPKMMYQSKYAERMAIGKKEILEHFKPEQLISFYKDWYRPDLMAVIVVGDIDVAQMEQKIKAHFGSYKNPKNEKPRQIFEVPNHKELFVAVESDKEKGNAQVQVYYKDKDKRKKTITVGDYRERLIESLFTSMINKRLEELVNGPNPPFTYGYSFHSGTWAREKEAYQSFAMVADDQQLSALKVLLTENLRAKKFGFTEGEFERSKKDMLANSETSYNERDKSESENYVWQYQSHFLEQEPNPGISWNYSELKRQLPTIKLSEINEVIKKYISDENRVIVLTGPEKEGVKKPTELEVKQAIQIDENAITPYEDKAVVASLLKAEPKAGSIVSTAENKVVGTTTFILSNGAKLTYKKTDFKNDEILFEAVSIGGSNLFSNEDMKKTQFAMDGLSEAGFSGLKTNDISKFLSGKLVSVSPYVSDTSEGLNGSSTPADIETLFQMAYAYFTDLNNDPEAFESYKQKQSNFFKNLGAQPQVYFSQEFYKQLFAENPRFIGIFPDEKAWVNADYALAFNKYKERFANAADFEFFLVGNVDEAIIKQLAAKYIASLPATGAKDTVKDLGYRMIKGEHKITINKGKDPKSNVTIMYYGDTQYSSKEAMTLKALGEVLTIKLIEELREKESGVYGISARGNMNKIPYGSYSFRISFPCGPENADKLIASALKQVQLIVDKGPEEKDLTKFKEGEIQDLKKEQKENQFWLSALVKAYTYNVSANEINEAEKRIQQVTAKDIQEAAKKYLTKEKVIGLLMPEK